MAILKRAAAAPFTVPSLSEAHAEYAAQQRRTDELNNKVRDLRDEEAKLIAAIAADTSQPLRSNVAELLGEVPSQKTANRRRLAEVRQLLADVDDAISITTRRKLDLDTAAGVAVFNAVKPEVEKRMSALLQALDAVDDAARNVDDVLDAIERAGSQTGLNAPLRTANLRSNISVFVRDAREAGYNG